MLEEWMEKMAEMQIPDQGTNGCALHPYMFHSKHEANSEQYERKF